MPLSSNLNTPVDFFVVGSDNLDTDGDVLAAGQTITVTSADPATVVINLDATTRPNPADGTPCVASGTVSKASPVAQPNVAITITAQVVNADGSNAESATETVTVTPNTATAIGFLFGTPAIAAALKKA